MVPVPILRKYVEIMAPISSNGKPSVRHSIEAVRSMIFLESRHDRETSSLE
jgi:hypothetical protein